MPGHNPSFKPPASIPTQRMRSPSPPRAFIEPLSPSKPAPIEPSFNYPPLNSTFQIPTGQLEQAYTAATPKTRQRSNSHKIGHHRTPSTIDALAEAALSISPSFQLSAGSTRQDGYPQPHHGVTHHGASEPPHKRARSELLPSPFLTQHASRPATSYDGANGWRQGPMPHTSSRNAYESRVEEAALLLNFRTGGWPSSDAVLHPGAPVTSRPHANSFPSVSHHPWSPSEVKSSAQLLPPFIPYVEAAPAPATGAADSITNGLETTALPSPQQTSDGSGSSPKPHVGEFKVKEEAAHDAPNSHASAISSDIEMRDVPQQTQTPPEEADSEVRSTSASTSDVPVVVTKGKRGWPKGKPRGSTGRKAEKVASKRAAPGRKKASDIGKSGKGDASSDPIKHLVTRPRRKSVSDALPHELRTDSNATPTPRAQSVPADTLMLIHDALLPRPARRSNKAAADIICAGCATTRNGANGELDDWVSCNGCRKWFHVDCAGFRKAHEVRDVDKFFCNTCEVEHGKTTYVRKSSRAHASVDYAELQKGVLKTSEESNEHHYIQPIKDGTFQFDPETFPRIRPEMVTKEFFERSNIFVEPICIPAAFNPRPGARARQMESEGPATAVGLHDDPLPDMLMDDFEYDTVANDGQDGLDMVMPENLTVRQVCNLVGPDTPLDVIDVKTQNSGSKWTLSRWADYYEEDSDDKAIRNVISLEVSQSKLGRLLRRPKIVRDIDLQDNVWPRKEIEQGKFPKVQYYCLMSVADSYTDFHIDFGGSSVYYHILKGKKTFFFIPPKPKHLKAYEEWNDSPQQNYTFLPHITKECYRVDLSEGDTMLIPSGWIHAVWTPETSLVIGGNFLNRMSYHNQFKVVEIEKANETPMKFRYPFFQKIMWYTTIQYLQTDPMPAAVTQLFHDGKQFARELPIWADFDGSLAENDARPGARSVRYYSQAEVEGLPDLVNFIFRTVMLVMGRVEGVSGDRMKRVNASIPKGHGEPLEIAKAFALWVAWKRGNEDPPAWAHPDAVLPNSKEEGPPKKLSARALKEMERKEAIAAYRVAPDRQSARVKNAAAAAAAASAMTAADAVPNGVATPERASSTNAAHHPENHQNSSHDPSASMKPESQHGPRVLLPLQAQAAPSQSQHPRPSVDNAFAGPQLYPHHSVAPQAMHAMLNGMSGQHLSTPKTSVLGPKRVACDACRKRRIRCKHKEMVVQTAPSPHASFSPGALSNPTYQPSEIFDNITVTPPKPGEAYNHFANPVNRQQTPNGHGSPNGIGANGSVDANGQSPFHGPGPLPGTNAYVNANIPMTMNGVPIFGEVPKRGRSKACFECRKSKRRCVHDEHGNVDPIKAAESPIPRGSLSSVKKRPSEEDGTPVQARKKSRVDDYANGSDPSAHRPNLHASSPTASQHSYLPAHSSSYQPPIDPNLFTMHVQPTNHIPYADHQYPYHNIPTLEQIASEVLHIDGPDHHEPHDQQLNGDAKADDDPQDRAHDGNHHVFSSTNGTIDSSHPLAEIVRANSEMGNGVNHAMHHLPAVNPVTVPDPPFHSANGDHPMSAQPATGPPATSIDMQLAKPSIEVSRPTSKSGGANNLPLYRPPAPLSQSPEVPKRGPHAAPPDSNTTAGTAAALSSASPRGLTAVAAQPSTTNSDLALHATRALHAAVTGDENGGSNSDPLIDDHTHASPPTTTITMTSSPTKTTKAKDAHPSSQSPSPPTTELKSLELAKLLHQDELGLRPRNK